VQWWAAWYPGAEPGGGGYVAQRIFSAKTERDGVLATLAFQVAHYALRPWPWILTGLATVILYPMGVGPTHDKEAAYVQAFVDLLPTPWRGFMMAGFAAAYMSTVATQLNWGASYLVNDFYRRFVIPAAAHETSKGRSSRVSIGAAILGLVCIVAGLFVFRRTSVVYGGVASLIAALVWVVAARTTERGAPGERHYVTISRWATVFLFLASTVVTAHLSSVEGAWKLLLAIGAGTGLVFILRWYWWRINAWSEISAMIASFVISLIMMRTVALRFAPGDPNADAVVMLVTVAISTAVWLTVTFVTAPEKDAVLDSFYNRVRPGGPGWARVSDRLGYGREQIPGGALAWTNWVAGIVAVYASLFGIGKIVFGELTPGLVMLVIAILAFSWIARSFRSETPPPAIAKRQAQAVAAD